MDEGFSGILGAVVIAAVIGFGLITVNSDPASTAGRGPVCNSIAAIGCTALSGVGSALNDPDAYARSHP